MYRYGSGGSLDSAIAMLWWTNWWNRSVTNDNGIDGWTLQAKFLKEVVKTVDKHESTLGYEILNEPQVRYKDQWDKIGRYNTFMVNELRTVTQKTIAYSMNIPIQLTSSINNTPENMAKMAPANKTNIVFKISIYGIPAPDSYNGKRFAVLIKAAQLAGVPLYIGEWNNIYRDRIITKEGRVDFEINYKRSDITQEEVNLFVQTFKDVKAWGWAFWLWNFKPHKIANYNLITITNDGNVKPTKYFEYLKKAISKHYGKYDNVATNTTTN